MADAGFPFELPATLVAEGFSLRAETDADVPFAMQLYASTREDELAQVDWSAEQKSLFLAQQFAAQRHHYKTQMACDFALIEHHGAPVGRLYLEQRQTQISIVDIALMPDARGRGVGRAIIEALIATAAVSGRGIGIFVERFNPALRLYRRLGFTEISETEVYLEMERAYEPGGDQPKHAS
ncbi:MAG: GNAT family N-acetyltransferase [Pseudomonadota bacterium]|uniref:GNAT family N-acetyltransferase n=1 Tax=Sphingomonas sp. ERG5 TaxID=1381597 RepID=UPI000A4C06A8|nr:GNAT family N-acetyltransferase [Sphingomonas sp. ERG5]